MIKPAEVSAERVPCLQNQRNRDRCGVTGVAPDSDAGRRARKPRLLGEHRHRAGIVARTGQDLQLQHIVAAVTDARARKKRGSRLRASRKSSPNRRAARPKLPSSYTALRGRDRRNGAQLCACPARSRLSVRRCTSFRSPSSSTTRRCPRPSTPRRRSRRQGRSPQNHLLRNKINRPFVLFLRLDAQSCKSGARQEVWPGGGAARRPRPRRTRTGAPSNPASLGMPHHARSRNPPRDSPCSAA
jgi:hypothetical protein